MSLPFSLSFFLDGLILFTIGFFMFSAYRYGIVKSGLSLAGTVVSCVMAMSLSPWLAEKMNIESVSGLLMGNISEAFTNADEQLPGMDGFEERFVQEFTEMTGTGEVLDSTIELAKSAYAERAVSIIAFLIVLAVAMSLCKIAINVADIYFKLPVIASINRFFGLIFGFLEGLVMCCAVCLLVSLIIVFLSDPWGLAAAINKTSLFRHFYNNNLLAGFLKI